MTENPVSLREVETQSTKLSLGMHIAAIGAVVLVMTELFSAIAVGVAAMVDLQDASLVVWVVLAAIVVPPFGWLSYRLLQMAYEAEFSAVSDLQIGRGLVDGHSLSGSSQVGGDVA